jgi:2-polyprenyl-3-methyl-5-hydroxy-6-metoxy-1,4-benzoquinol methylase
MMFDLEGRDYPYMEEVNEGILRQFKKYKPEGKVLDVGCGRGQLGEAIQALGWEVWGIERDEGASRVAEKRLARVIRSDISDEKNLQSSLEHERFAALVFSDVLEHLYDPLTVLTRYLKYVPAGGRVFVSVPNAVLWINRFKWFLGHVEYEDTGVMDRTHVRFFTFRTAKLLLEEAGCKVVKVDLTPHLVRAFLPLIKSFSKSKSTDVRSIIDSKPYLIYMRYVYPVERLFASLWRGMFAFRIILVAEKLKD